MNEWLAEISMILISYLSSIVKCCPCSQYGVMDLILVQKSYSKPYGNENREKDQTHYSKHMYIYYSDMPVLCT